MKIMAQQLLQKNAAEIRSADFFNIMGNGVTDVAIISQLKLCICWVDDNLDCREDEDCYRTAFAWRYQRECHFGSYQECYYPNKFQFENCWGQCYDGCSTMKGEKKGVTKQVKSKEPKALLIHCFTHFLNLAVGDIIKASKVLKNYLETSLRSRKL